MALNSSSDQDSGAATEEPADEAPHLLEPPFEPGAGAAFSAPLPETLASRTDLMDASGRSRLRLLENGHDFGLGEQLHDAVSRHGLGRYSHWGSSVLFSTPDNTDPNTNGRSYTLALAKDAGRAAPHAVSRPNLSFFENLLRRRGVRRLAYFHTDHFEPWNNQSLENKLDALSRFAERTASSRFGRKLSLFYKPDIGYELPSPDQDGYVSIGLDDIRFQRADEAANRHAPTHIAPLRRDLGHEFHVHIHHELWTQNDSRFPRPVAEWVNANSSPERDRRRLDLYVRLILEIIRGQTGDPLQRWGFIHGCWALNGSDTEICRIEDEMAILMRHGCFGDFTFPAGRVHCDPSRIEQPYTCLPATALKAYDLDIAAPRPLAAGASAFSPDRFFIWNSEVKGTHSSLDVAFANTRAQVRRWEDMLSAWLQSSVVLGDTLYLKTHAHSVDPEFRQWERDSYTAHTDPDVVWLFDMLQRTCDQAQVPIELRTVNEVMTELQAFDGAAAPVQVPAAG